MSKSCQFYLENKFDHLLPFSLLPCYHAVTSCNYNSLLTSTSPYASMETTHLTWQLEIVIKTKLHYATPFLLRISNDFSSNRKSKLLSVTYKTLHGLMQALISLTYLLLSLPQLNCYPCFNGLCGFNTLHCASWESNNVLSGFVDPDFRKWLRSFQELRSRCNPRMKSSEAWAMFHGGSLMFSRKAAWMSSQYSSCEISNAKRRKRQQCLLWWSLRSHTLSLFWGPVNILCHH